MPEMNFLEATKRIEVLLPMCSFNKSAVRCTNEELYYRRHYRQAIEAAHTHGGDSK